MYLGVSWCINDKKSRNSGLYKAKNYVQNIINNEPTRKDQT